MASAIGQVLVGSRKELIIGLVHNHSTGLEKAKGDVRNALANEHRNTVQAQTFVDRLANFCSIRIQPFAHIFALQAEPFPKRLKEENRGVHRHRVRESPDVGEVLLFDRARCRRVPPDPLNRPKKMGFSNWSSAL